MHKAKNTLVLGASPNPSRASFVTVSRMINKGYSVVAFGAREGIIGNVEIETQYPVKLKFHTITLYLNPKNQKQYYAAILDSRPKRIIFNPGTENPELAMKARKLGIETLNACTLVMLSLDSY